MLSFAVLFPMHFKMWVSKLFQHFFHTLIRRSRSSITRFINLYRCSTLDFYFYILAPSTHFTHVYRQPTEEANWFAKKFSVFPSLAHVEERFHTKKKFSVFCWYDKSTLWNEEVGRKQTSWMITPLTKRRLIMKKFYCVSIEFRPHSEFAELERGFNSFLSPLRYSLVCYAYHKFGTWNEQFSNVSDDNLSSPMLVTNLLLRLWFKEELLN